MSWAHWPAMATGFRRAALPLAAYYAITLAVPLANGAAQSGGAFVKHAVVVLAVPLGAIALGGLVRSIIADCPSSRRLQSPRTPMARRV